MSTAEQEDLSGAAPYVEWETIWGEGEGLEPGQHLSVFGPTGSGKTYTLIWACETFPGNSVLVVTKGRDELVRRLERERGWQVASDLDDILLADGKPGRYLRRTWNDRWEKRERPPQRIVFHPQVPGTRRRADVLAAQVGELLDRAYEYCRGSERSAMLVAIDETMYAAMELGIGKDLVVIWNEGRAMRLSVAAAMQRPAWIPKSSKSAPTVTVIFPTSDPDDVVDLAKIAGYRERKDFEDDLDSLGDHEHLLVIGQGGRNRRVYRSRVVIRKRRGSSGTRTENGGGGP